MKKIAVPVIIAITVLAGAWYVSARAISRVTPPDNPIINPKNQKPGDPVVVKNGPLHMTLSTSNANVLKGSNGEVLLQVDLEAIEAEIANEKRVPLNIALVIDRSGSMADRGKLEYARTAAQDLIDRLNKNDRVAVVIYDDVAEVLVPSTKVTNPEAIKNKIAAISDRGSTNLGGGLTLGHNQVKEYFDFEGINQVIILSDGLANVGVTSIPELKKMASAWGEAGVRITSMGLGADFNEDLMMSVADASGGHFYFIESPNQLAGIYEKELKALMQTVAKNANVTVELSDGVRFVSLYGYEAKVDGNKIGIPLGDFNSGQHRVLMLRLDVPAEKMGRVQVASVKLDYLDALNESKKVDAVAALDVNCVEDVAKVEKSRNLAVESNDYWLGNSDESSTPMEYVQEGKKDKAIGWYNKKIEEIREKNKAYGNEQLERQAKQFEKERDELEDLDTPDSEAGRGYIKTRKSNQRLDSLGYVQ